MNIELKLDNMRTAACVDSIRHALEQIPGIIKVSADIKAQMIHITSSRPVSFEKLNEALFRIGFPVRLVISGFEHFVAGDEGQGG